MQCFVYKGERKADHYLYLGRALEELEAGALPQALLDMLGPLSLVIEINLSGKQKLAQADAEQVRSDLRTQGFYLQMPKTDMAAEEDRWFN